MLRSVCLGFLASWALATASGAAAQEKADAWALSGGFDLLELRAGKGDEIFIWDAAFSLGDDVDQVMLMTAGGGALGNQIDEVDAQLYYGRTIGAATLLVGARRDIKPHDDWHAAVGVQGTFATRLSWETYMFLAENGKVTGEGQLIYNLPITQALYFEPRVKLGWSAQADQAESSRSGLTEGEASLRVRYSLSDQVNAYAGVIHQRLLGGTRRLGRSQGDELQSTMAVIGIGFDLQPYTERWRSAKATWSRMPRPSTSSLKS